MKRIVLMMLLMAVTWTAQAQLVLRGTVIDPDGAAVPDARLLLYRTDVSGRWTAATDAAGEYRFERLQAGRYILEVEKRGFGRLSQSVVLPEDAGVKEEVADVELRVEGVPQSVVVTATDSPVSMDELAKAVTVIDAAEIQDRNEFFLGEALRTVPGIQVLNLGGPGQQTTIRTRGLRSDATAVLVDGLRFRDASTTQGDASSLLGTMNFAGTERVEVLRGSGSSLYGTNAVGGAVNLITRDGGAPTHGGLVMEGGGLGMMRGRATVGGGALNDRFRYSGSLLHLHVLHGVDGNDTNRDTAAQGFARFDFNEAMNLTGRVWANDNFVMTNSGPTTATIPAANFPDQTIVPVRMMSPENVRVFLAGGQPDYTGVTLIPGRDDPDARRSTRFATTALVFRHAVTPRANWQASYQKMSNWRVFADGPGGSGFQPQANNFSRFEGDIDTADIRGTALLTPWLTVTGGYEFEREVYADRQDNNLPGTSRVASRTRIQQDANAGYFSSQISLLDRRLQIVTSGRGQFFRLSRPTFDFTGAATNYETVPLNAPPKALTGDLAVSYLISATNTKLRAHVGNAYRAPSLYERFGGGFGAVPATGEIQFTAYGDPRLSPDRYNNVDAGIDQYLFGSRVRASATWFYSRVVTITGFDFSGGIDAATDPFGRFIGYINGSGGISRGLELGIEAKPTRGTIVNFAYSHVNANQDQDIAVAGFFTPARVHQHVTSFVLSHDWTRRFNTTVDFIHMSPNYDAYFAAGRSRAFLNPAFSKTDAVVSYLVWEGERRSARLYGKVDNLFNQRIYHQGWLMPQAVGVVGLNYQF
jgi:vitamin B12 transporter